MKLPKIVQSAMLLLVAVLLFAMAVLGINHVCDGHPQAKQEYIEYGCKGWHWLAHDAAGFFTAALAVITGFLAYYTYGLYSTTVELSRDGNKAADRQFKLASQTAERQLRAYVMTGAFDLKGTNGQSAPTLTIELRNSGQTPARHVTSRMDISFRAPHTDDSQFTLDHVEAGSRSPLAPDATYHVTLQLHRRLYPVDWEGIKNGDMALFAWGRIDYLDAFDQPRWTTFRAVTKAEHVARGEPYHMSVCENGNDIA